MTLEDFFTLTELKDGLTTPTRVNDLLTIMQNQQESIAKNASEATRQWSAVANIIAATENTECLDLFIQLNGLWFIDKWLNDAQKLINDAGNGSLVIALLEALKRLQVDHHQSVGSVVGLTVQGLLGHSSLVVREKAKDLWDRWAPVQSIDGAPTDVNSVDVVTHGNVDQENVEQPAYSDTVHRETDKEERVTQEVIRETGTEIIRVEYNKCKSESSPLTETFGCLEDAKERPEIDSLASLSSPLEDKTLTSSTDVDHAATKTEIMDDKSDKDEEVIDSGESQSPDHWNTTTEVITTSRVRGGGLQESHPKSSSNSESDEDEKKEADDSGSDSPLSKPSMKSQNDDLISQRPSDMELDYGMVDPLELARQVAIEVELEVDSQEQSCSTSTNEKEHQSAGGLGNEFSSGPNAPEPMNNLETLDTNMEESEKGFSGFDLNKEVSFEEIETDHPISIVSASSVANRPPFAPLQFEGEKTFSSSSSHSNSCQRLNHFEFDLNVSEISEDQQPSRLQLDLNSLGDSDASVVTLDWKHDASQRQNRPQSPAVSSSMQPSFRNIDLNLNDHLTVPNNQLFNNKRDESVISIFGTQLEVNHKDTALPPQHNGRILDTSVDFNLGRPGSGLGLGFSMPYSKLPAYGYGHNGFTVGPMYGPSIPYMVDSRGAPIIPPAFSQPFFFNMAAAGAPSGSNGAGPSLNTLDLNSGFMTERENCENNNGGLRQFFNHNQASSSSVIGGKREQPDSGWELFPVNYKHLQPPWQ
ncbi:hypothetical protein R6Q59_033324 [Mikania micrantha]|uniref:TFIIS N-terminal domain-containing protein n=1 Tax=Mikania micrantha TaxID=192012 RepID=A0A5N6P5D1_9ASTR|nr:hypothetical protein E3N88_11750 [Mikania micrantha]